MRFVSPILKLVALAALGLGCGVEWSRKPGEGTGTPITDSAAAASPGVKVAVPRGLFVCRGPAPTPDREVDFPFIDGWLVRPLWSKVEPEERRYDWNYIDREIATARRLRKRITLMVLGGPQAPEWVYRAGARDFHFSWGSRYRPAEEARIPVLWDEVYLRKWTAMVQALGQRYGREPTVALVHISGATENGLEMQLPSSARDRTAWLRTGYTPEKAITAWKRIIDTFARAFPNSPLDIDIHPVLGSDRVAEEVAAYGYGKLGRRFGVFAGWLSGRPVEQDRHHAGMHAIAQRYGRLSFAAFQMIGNESNQPERFAAGLSGAVAQGMGWGSRYFEIWKADVVNPQLHPTLQELASRVKK
jgi:hypothetical protein